MRCRSGRTTQRMGGRHGRQAGNISDDTSSDTHPSRLQDAAVRARTRDSTATFSQPRATVYFGRKVPSCHRMAFYDRFPVQLPSEMAVKCLAASYWHFTTIPLRAHDATRAYPSRCTSALRRTCSVAPLHSAAPSHRFEHARGTGSRHGVQYSVRLSGQKGRDHGTHPHRTRGAAARACRASCPTRPR